MIRQALISTLLLSLSVQAQNMWQNYKDSLRKDESLLRFYTFENLKAEDRSIPSFGSENEPLRAQAPLEIVAGRFDGKTAVHPGGQGLHGADLDACDRRRRPSRQCSFDERHDSFHRHRLLGRMARHDELSRLEHIVGTRPAISCKFLSYRHEQSTCPECLAACGGQLGRPCPAAICKWTSGG